MRFVFVMDSLDRVNPDLDTTYGFVQSALDRGHRCLHCLIHQVERRDDRVTAVVRQLELRDRDMLLVGEPTRVDLSEVDAVLIRKDPPFDVAYSYATLLLEGLAGKTVVINSPQGLRRANEKLYALEFVDHIPPTLVTSDRERIFAFTEEVGGAAVIKPLDGAGGYGVMAVRTDDSNAKAIVDLLTKEGSELAIVQQFIPEVRHGDKRVLMLDGEPLGAILRVPTGGDLRANIHVGGRVVPTELTAKEQAVVAAVGPRLRADGLVFVGLDLIGERLTEVNVTSPTGIRELSSFTGIRQSDAVIEWVERAAG